MKGTGFWERETSGKAGREREREREEEGRMKKQMKATELLFFNSCRSQAEQSAPLAAFSHRTHHFVALKQFGHEITLQILPTKYLLFPHVSSQPSNWPALQTWPPRVFNE